MQIISIRNIYIAKAYSISSEVIELLNFVFKEKICRLLYESLHKLKMRFAAFQNITTTMSKICDILEVVFDKNNWVTTNLNNG